MAKQARPRLSDVAKLAGVSLGSASNALSGSRSVKPETLKRVEMAMRQLGYVRNHAARALASRRTYSIGAVFPTVNNPTFADAIQAIQQRTQQAGYQLLIASHEYDSGAELSHIRNLIERGVEGMLLVGTDHNINVLDTLKSWGQPYILMWSLDQCHDNYCVGFYNKDAGSLIANHLLALGHTKFAVIGGKFQNNDRMRMRVDGVRDALMQNGLELNESQVFECPLTLMGGRSGLKQALESNSKPTAIICLTDILALGASAEARELKIDVPSDISIAGIDNSGFSSVAYPAITTIDIPTSDIGRISATNIIGLIEDKQVPRIESVEIKLIVRASTGPLKSFKR
jgi:LacI family transcriptional regulator